jgi:hypothetical protein
MYNWTKALHSNDLALFTDRLLTTALLHCQSLFRLYLPFTAIFTENKVFVPGFSVRISSLKLGCSISSHDELFISPFAVKYNYLFREQIISSNVFTMEKKPLVGSYRGFTITPRHATLGWIPLDD